MARPKKKDNEKRKHQVNFRLTDDEYSVLLKQSQMSGLDKGTWIRKVIFSKRMPKAKLEPINQKLFIELSRQGNNLNQLLRKVNSTAIDKTTILNQINVLNRVYKLIIKELIG